MDTLKYIYIYIHRYVYTYMYVHMGAFLYTVTANGACCLAMANSIRLLPLRLAAAQTQKMVEVVQNIYGQRIRASFRAKYILQMYVFFTSRCNS